MFIFRVLNTVPYSNEAGAKDLIAGLHSFLTSNVLVGLAILVSYKQFGGKPIECMLPTDFTGAWGQYAENYCWAQDTYFVPLSSPVVDHSGNRTRSAEKISYYQWMPFFLLFEAACFRLPCLIWKYFASQSGMRVGEILRIASDDHNAVPEVKKGNIRSLCVHLQGALRFQKRLKLRNIVPHKILRFLNVKYSSYYVLLIYFLSKFAFFINVGVQTQLLDRYLLPHNKTRELGLWNSYDIWRSLWNGNDTWMNTGLFPRVTLCDFQTHTVQCVLLVNILTEKIFIVLWAWYLVLSALTLCNIVSWIFTMFNDTAKEHFIISNLDMCEFNFDKKDMKSREHVERFISKYLGLDGILLLRLVAQHADVVFTTELIGALYESYLSIEDRRQALKKMDLVMPLIRPESRTSSPTKKADVSPYRRKSSVSLKKKFSRTVSFDGEVGEKRYFDDSDEDQKQSSKPTSPKSNRKMSKAT